MRVTVGAHETAVAPGELTKQTWASQNRRTFHFAIRHPTPPRHLALAVGESLYKKIKSYPDLLVKIVTHVLWGIRCLLL